ncbi:MAG: hypothetical protein PVF79_06140, partial [Desulfobacterales bacterium]
VNIAKILEAENYCECAGKTVEEQWMKVPYNEGLAAHIGPESCVYARKGIGEALTGGMRAGLLSCERIIIQGADIVHKTGRQHRLYRYGERRLDPAWSENLCTYTSFSIGNREVPRLTFGDGSWVGAVNPEGARQQ